MLCSKHYQRARLRGELPVGLRRAKRRAAGRAKGKYGEGHVNVLGYREVRTSSKNQLEHRVLVEKAIGRRLTKGEVVHHVDGNKSNNAISNLVLCPNQAYHKMLHRTADFDRGYTKGFADGLAQAAASTEGKANGSANW
jgi:hypothetical protein